MQPHRPAIAVVTPSILTGLGLESILRRIIPMAEGELVVAGLLNKQIAQRLDVALTTVISHRRNLVRKLGIRSVAGLTIYAVTKGYVDAEQLGEQ